MFSRVRLYSKEKNEIYDFLNRFYNNHLDINKSVFNNFYKNMYEWENIYENPLEIASIIGVYIDNIDNFNIKMWVDIEKDIFINITNNNGNKIIKYLYIRYLLK